MFGSGTVKVGVNPSAFNAAIGFGPRTTSAVFLEGCDQIADGVTGLQNIKEYFRSDSGQQNEDVDPFCQQSCSESERRGVVFETDLAKGGTHKRPAAIPFDQADHLTCHTAFERGNSKALKG